MPLIKTFGALAALTHDMLPTFYGHQHYSILLGFWPRRVWRKWGENAQIQFIPGEIYPHSYVGFNQICGRTVTGQDEFPVWNWETVRCSRMSCVSLWHCITKRNSRCLLARQVCSNSVQKRDSFPSVEEWRRIYEYSFLRCVGLVTTLVATNGSKFSNKRDTKTQLISSATSGSNSQIASRGTYLEACWFRWSGLYSASNQLLARLPLTINAVANHRTSHQWARTRARWRKDAI